MEIHNLNGINYYTKGEGAPLYLIHGFPDCAENFENQIEYFAKEGFQVIAPYLPGFHESDEALDSYQTLRISEVLINFIESLTGEKKIYIYGHDWGAPIVYGISQLKPDLVKKFSAASVPYGLSLQMAFLTDGDQQRKSWYMFFFQLPLAEMSVPMNDYEFIHRLWREWSPDLKHYKHYSDVVVKNLSRPNVLAKALAYYRATFQPELQLERLNTKSVELSNSKIGPPCLYFHGVNDGCIDYRLALDMEGFFKELKINIMEDCGHFLHLEKPDEFNEALLDFFTNS